MKTRMWILFVLVALSAIPSFAQDRPRLMLDEPVTGEAWSGESAYSTGRWMDNPCTAVQDLYWVDYAAYVQGAQVEAGIDRYLLEEDTTMGGTYAAAGSSSSDVAYANTFAIRKYHKVNTNDNFHVVTVITFDPASRYTSITVETACGNGMPDSPQ